MANVQDVARFFVYMAAEQAKCDAGDAMTNLRLQKLLYFAQGWQLARTGAPLFDDDLEAWTYGPVVKDVYDRFRRYGRNAIEETEEPDWSRFTAQELDLLYDVAREYDGLSTSKLVSMTHSDGSPWEETASGAVISKDAIRRYFAEQEPLETFDAKLSRLPSADVRRDADGVILLPADEYEDWEDYADEA